MAKGVDDNFGMTEKHENSLHYSQLALTAWTVRLILTTWIIFAVYKFNMNPVFFGITIAFACFRILSVSYLKIVVTKKSLIFIRSRLLPFLNGKDEYFFSQIVNIEFDNSRVQRWKVVIDWIIRFLSSSIGSGPDAYLRLNLTENQTRKYTAFGSRKRNREIVNLINERIKTNANTTNTN